MCYHHGPLISSLILTSIISQLSVAILARSAPSAVVGAARYLTAGQSSVSAMTSLAPSQDSVPDVDAAFDARMQQEYDVDDLFGTSKAAANNTVTVLHVQEFDHEVDDEQTTKLVEPLPTAPVSEKRWRRHNRRPHNQHGQTLTVATRPSGT